MELLTVCSIFSRVLPTNYVQHDELGRSVQWELRLTERAIQLAAQLNLKRNQPPSAIALAAPLSSIVRTKRIRWHSTSTVVRISPLVDRTPLILLIARLPQRPEFVIHESTWEPARPFYHHILPLRLAAGTEFQLGHHHFRANYADLHGKVYSTLGPMGTSWWVPMA